MQENFFVYQRRALRPLLVWGIGSSVLGALMLPFAGFWRHFGLQAVAWGVIDVLLAMIGRRSALLKAERMATGELEARDALREAEQFRKILTVNAGLDVGYILVGLAVALRYAERPDRQGLGYGIATQGAFLLVFDALLARQVGQRMDADDHE
ncbi:hypothetical protein EYB53_017815 [Candidatus Chloroploca sp. M-50]|uniref:DUF2178 domain-containing protein n=1 Tax=Candidatus Chloroploca mongolica TaxID=2528176 RepID=A0ABS4DDR7_9CHLR|nr:hypothetical protein [Candidatus Chloroploca mongolica]MBP1467575.1 hypothetical protein [Candidatus Chloroploca mongolica]